MANYGKSTCKYNSTKADISVKKMNGVKKINSSNNGTNENIKKDRYLFVKPILIG